MNSISFALSILFCTAFFGCLEDTKPTSEIEIGNFRNTPKLTFEDVTHSNDSNFVALFSPIDSIKFILKNSANEINEFNHTTSKITYDWKIHHQIPIQLTFNHQVMENNVSIDFFNVDNHHWIAIKNKIPQENNSGYIQRHSYYFENETVQYLFVQASTPDGLAPYQINLINNRFALDHSDHLVQLLGKALRTLIK